MADEPNRFDLHIADRRRQRSRSQTEFLSTGRGWAGPVGVARLNFESSLVGPWVCCRRQTGVWAPQRVRLLLYVDLPSRLVEVAPKPVAVQILDRNDT